MNERLLKLSGAGQSVWIDSISRDDLVEGGALHELIEDGVVGVTSNTTIFKKVISVCPRYDNQYEEVSQKTDDPNEIFLQLARVKIRRVCDLLMPLYKCNNSNDF